MIVVLAIIAVLDFSPLLGISTTIDTVVTLMLGFVFIIAHGAVTLGWRNIIAFIVITFVVSFAAEAIGVATGLVFGPYHYTNLLGPKLLGVPPMIQVGYVGIGYASMIMARLILGFKQITGWGIVTAAFVGAFIMTSWDVTMDPFQSTASGDWIWHTGGPYFGVPLHNYAGWFGTVFVFMLVYFWYTSRNSDRPNNALIENSTAHWSLPIVYYAVNALGLINVPWVGGVSLPYASPANYGGTVAALSGSLCLIGLFVMGGPVLFALSRLLLDSRSAKDAAAIAPVVR